MTQGYMEHGRAALDAWRAAGHIRSSGDDSAHAAAAAFKRLVSAYGSDRDAQLLRNWIGAGSRERAFNAAATTASASSR